jgi:single-stranded-DNA-specific exonuclease
MIMNNNRLEPFQKAMRAAAASIIGDPGRAITLVHHNDTDGITAGAILRKALTGAGFAVEHIPIERVHPAFLPAIHTRERRLILYADLGGQAAETIGAYIRKRSRVIILDHHLPAIGEFSGLLQVNPELFGIDGDSECAAATAAWLFAVALNTENEDLAVLAILGATGDHQMAGDHCAGLNLLALEAAVAQGALLRGNDAASPWLLPCLQRRSLREADELIISLAVNGYYRHGADLALALCLEGPDDRIESFAADMKEIQRERFERELAGIPPAGIAREGAISWIDVADRFYPLGLKAIGLFCEELIRKGVVGAKDYVAGFQRFPEENPYLGRFSGRETKVSFRVTPALRRRIETGEKPDLMRLVPEAVRRVGGFAEGCHRYSAASTIPEERKADFVRLLAEGAARG